MELTLKLALRLAPPPPAFDTPALLTPGTWAFTYRVFPTTTALSPAARAEGPGLLPPLPPNPATPVNLLPLGATRLPPLGLLDDLPAAAPVSVGVRAGPPLLGPPRTVLALFSSMMASKLFPMKRVCQEK